MFGKSKGGSKQWETGTQSGQTGFDPLTDQFRQAIWGATQGAGGGVPPAVQQALDAISGNASAAQKFMNPYQQQVIDANNAQWQRTNQQTMNAVNDRATQARAFGGSRAGIATGEALAANNLAQQQQTAGLLQSGYRDAMGQAMNAANLGFTAGSPDLWRLNILRQGFAGLPYGQTYSGTTGRTSTGTGYQMNFGK